MVRFDNGERFAMLVKRCSGMPLFEPTVYVISMVRARNVAFATIYNNLRAIMHLYTWANSNGFNIEQRFAMGGSLSINEIDSLADAVGIRYDLYRQSMASRTEPRLVPGRTGPLLERYRKKAKGNAHSVESVTKATRLRYIRNYLDWLALQCLKGHSTSVEHSELEADRTYLSKALQARIPPVRNLSFFGKREGLSHETERRLRQVIDPESPENPWRDMGVRIRNRLFILSSLVLGVRRGELLVSRVDDVNFQGSTFFIRRAPDEPNDPRIYQPNAKTRDRILPLDSDLAQLLYDYVVSVRGKVKAARKHAFLFVALDTGEPLSMASVTKIFATLRRRIPHLPDDLTAHVMRHTWNDRFSEMMDKNKVPEEEEKKLRSYLMGWSETSGTAAAYTRRHIRKKSNEVSLKLQRQMVREVDNEGAASKEP